MRVVIDTDPAMGVLGGDPEDAWAVIMALNSPELDVAAVTVVNGNVPVGLGYQNARHLLDLMGHAELPLAPGPARPLMPHRTDQLRWQRAKERLPRIVPPCDHTAVRPRAPQLLADTLLAGEEPTTLIAIGPLTNIALALLSEPRIVDAVERVVIMGGTGREPGNVTPAAEFNFWCDPEAAAIVLAAGWPITLVTLEVCHRVHVTREALASINGNSPLSRFVHEACVPWLELHEVDGAGGFPLFDTLTVASVLRPELLTTRPALVEVDISAGPSAGATVIWFDRDVHGAPLTHINADVAVDVDVPAFLALYRDRILSHL
jgi:inosine-uridine nucleoside N-ribohydrolase